MRTFALIAVTTIGLAFATPPADAADWATELLKRVPDSANSLIIVDIKGLHASPMGVKEGWAKKHEQDFYGGVTGIPPAVEQLLIGSYLDPSTLTKNWDVTIAQIDSPINATGLARRAGGAVDATNPELIASPRNAFFTVFEPQLVGARSPANRQEMLRWQRFAAKSTSAVVSPYLQQVAKDSAGKHVVLALEMTDVLDAPGITARLKKSKTLQQGYKVDM